jgi:GT2 family glycosyltransferase
MENVVAIVVTYNRIELLKECLLSLEGQTYPVQKIIIVDNCSTDGTKEFLHSLPKSKFLIIHLKKNTGGSGGFYIGCKYAIKEKCDWVWAMDDDTIPEADALKELISAKNILNSKVSFLASTVYGPNGEPMNLPLISNSVDKNGYKNWYFSLENGLVKIDAATFVSTLISYSAIKQCGCPHPFFFIWGDDVEFTQRLTKYYGPAYFVGKSKVIHKRKGAKNLSMIDENNPSKISLYKYMYRNTLLNEWTYFGLKGYLKYRLSMHSDFFRIIFSMRKYKLKKIICLLNGFWGFIFKTYNFKVFKKRFTNFQLCTFDDITEIEQKG